jgi:hypothetical protein
VKVTRFIVGLCEDSSKITRRVKNRLYNRKPSQIAGTAKMEIIVLQAASTRTLDSTTIFNAAGKIEHRYCI